GAKVFGRFVPFDFAVVYGHGGLAHSPKRIWPSLQKIHEKLTSFERARGMGRNSTSIYGEEFYEV
ncbi:hypothetical protein JTE90_028881, partial [Oedothorax gibbosus]